MDKETREPGYYRVRSERFFGEQEWGIGYYFGGELKRWELLNGRGNYYDSNFDEIGSRIDPNPPSVTEVRLPQITCTECGVTELITNGYCNCCGGKQKNYATPTSNNP